LSHQGNHLILKITVQDKYLSLRLAHYFFVSKKVDQKTAVYLKNSATLLFPLYPALAGLRSLMSRRSEFSRMTGMSR